MSPARGERGPSGPAAQPPGAGQMSEGGVGADVAATVQWLRDRVLIEQLPQRYARGLDSREFDAARAVFRNDCRVKGSLVEDDIDPYWANLVPGVQAYEATMHFM